MQDIIITDALEVEELTQKKPGHFCVISIQNYIDNNLSHIKIAAKEILVLKFDDITEIPNKAHRPYKMANIEDCKKALKFLDGENPEKSYLVHCNAGISRSTAIVLGYFLSKQSYQEAVDRLYQIRPCASPNSHILKLMCQILGIINYPNIIEKIQSKTSQYKGNMRLQLAKKFLLYNRQKKQ